MLKFTLLVKHIRVGPSSTVTVNGFLYIIPATKFKVYRVDVISMVCNLLLRDQRDVC